MFVITPPALPLTILNFFSLAIVDFFSILLSLPQLLLFLRRDTSISDTHTHTAVISFSGKNKLRTNYVKRQIDSFPHSDIVIMS